VGALLLRNSLSLSLSRSLSLSLGQLGWNNYIACAEWNSSHCEGIERVIKREKERWPPVPVGNAGRAKQLSRYLQSRI